MNKIKTVLFGGYSKKVVQDTVSALERSLRDCEQQQDENARLVMQLDKAKQQQAQLQEENLRLEQKAAELESEIKMLQENREYLTVQLDKMQQEEHRQGENKLQEIGNIYVLAYDSAQEILRLAKEQAENFLIAAREKTEAYRGNAEACQKQFKQIETAVLEDLSGIRDKLGAVEAAAKGLYCKGEEIQQVRDEMAQQENTLLHEMDQIMAAFKEKARQQKIDTDSFDFGQSGHAITDPQLSEQAPQASLQEKQDYVTACQTGDQLAVKAQAAEDGNAEGAARGTSSICSSASLAESGIKMDAVLPQTEPAQNKGSGQAGFNAADTTQKAAGEKGVLGEQSSVAPEKIGTMAQRYRQMLANQNDDAATKNASVAAVGLSGMPDGTGKASDADQPVQAGRSNGADTGKTNAGLQSEKQPNLKHAASKQDVPPHTGQRQNKADGGLNIQDLLKKYSNLK